MYLIIFSSIFSKINFKCKFFYQLHDNQMSFNKKLINLRDKKKDLVFEINKSLDRAEQIQYLLGEPLEKLMRRPVLRVEEIPEK